MRKLILDSFLAGANFFGAIIFTIFKMPTLVLLDMVSVGLLLWLVSERYEAIKRGEVEP